MRNPLLNVCFCAYTFWEWIFAMINKTKYIDQIKKLHLKKTGIFLTEIEAQVLFENLIVLVATVYKPIRK